MDQARRVERLARPANPELALGQALKVLIDERKEPSERLAISLAMRGQKPGQVVTGLAHRGRSIRPAAGVSGFSPGFRH
jgi:hypothetical protein